MYEWPYVVPRHEVYLCYRIVGVKCPSYSVVKPITVMIYVIYSCAARLSRSFTTSLNGSCISLAPRTIPSTMPESKKNPSAEDTSSWPRIPTSQKVGEVVYVVVQDG